MISRQRALFLSIAVLFSTFAPAANANGETYQLVDREGHEQGEGTYEQLKSCGSGIFLGKRKGRTKLEILNQKGKILSNPTPAGCDLEAVICKWQRGSNVDEELPADALLMISKAGYHGIVDSQGKVVVPLEFDKIEQRSSEFCILEKVVKDSSSPKSFFFSCKTRVISKNGFTRMLEYGIGCEGLIPFCERVTPASKPRDPYHQDFNNREMTPSAFNQWGYCDVENNVIVPAQFEYASDYHEGFAIVKPKFTGFGMTFIDRRGSIIDSDIVAVNSFQDGLAIAARASGKDKKVGLINNKFRFVLPPLYDELKLVAKGIYAAKNARTGKYTAISSAGKKLFEFPNTVFQVREHGFSENDDESYIVVDMRDEHDSAKKSGTSALLSSTGKILIPPNHQLGQAWFGMVEVLARTKLTGENLWGIQNFSAEWLIPPQSSLFSIEGPNCLLKKVHNDHFDSESWRNYYSNRLEDFQKFLKDYDLIGMPYAEVTKLLGLPNDYKGVFEYNLIQQTWCAFDVDFKDGKVYRWRYNTTQSKGPDYPGESSQWYTKDMVFEPTDFLMEAKLIPKTSK